MAAITWQEWAELAYCDSELFYESEARHGSGTLYPLVGHSGLGVGREHAVAIAIPHTFRGYGATTFDEANRRYLEAHYPHDLCTSHGSLVYVFGAGGTDGDDESAAEIFEIIESLRDYPVLDDDTHAEVCHQWTLEQWWDYHREIAERVEEVTGVEFELGDEDTLAVAYESGGMDPYLEDGEYLTVSGSTIDAVVAHYVERCAAVV